MRSIRRSLLGYLLLLLAVALGAVGVLVDRFAKAAFAQREEAEKQRIEERYRSLAAEAKNKFHDEVAAQLKSLAKDVQWKTSALIGVQWDGRRPTFRLPEAPPIRAPDETGVQYRLRTQLLYYAAPVGPASTALAVAALEPRRTQVQGFSPYIYPGAPGWIAYDIPRMISRFQEALRKTFEDDEGLRHFQISLHFTVPMLSERTLVQVTARDLPQALPLDAAWLEPQAAEWEPDFDDVEVPGHGLCRRGIVANHAGRAFVFWIWLPPTPLPMPVPGPTYRIVFGRPDVILRVAVQMVRPYSELEQRLVADQQARDEQIAHVQDETRRELDQLRSRLILIGSVTFVSLVLGGWFIVARGLSPLRILSDAVSQVSEKDFRLPVTPGQLSRELAPIHARLTQTLTLLQRAFAREKQAVADISHELRTPIASLMATIDVALRKPRTPEQYRAALEECRLISKQLGQLVERIMTLASLDAGKDHTQFTLVEVAELVNGCAAVIRPLAAANDITVFVHCERPFTIETDAGKLREVLMNLLHNAVEYNKPAGRIELHAWRDNTAAYFEVRDTGIGIPPESRDKIFERFFRADSSRHSTGVHAGLGLSIVKEYLARLHGTIAVESEVGVGTTFRVTLPLTPPPGSSSGIIPPPATDTTTAEPPRTSARATSRDPALPTGS
ncbi:MAG: HAMP domain-containing sensor histidine kinase [Gemmataceae bacterium]|nr:HAMP domain-containing histidine kinase [Gemmata sp.]MDW8196826.1 HAMP domain-containing sensor histidine kinase [Gemmataceae bacterium]